MILTKLGPHVNEMMAVAVNNCRIFLRSRFPTISQNVNMANNAIFYCCVTSITVELLTTTTKAC